VFRNDTIPNIRDTEQFPSLSSASTLLNTSKLNFKEMVMKNTNTNTNTVSYPESVPEKPLASVAPREKTLPSHNYQKSLSLGNIFSSVFYGGDGDASGGGGGDGDDACVGGDDGGGPSISSVLVDSCDRKYDNLYKY
jgi:hypothetical protein